MVKQHELTRFYSCCNVATMGKQALEKAIAAAGSQAELARRLGLKQQHIWAWLHRDTQVPAERVLAIEAATGVSRHDLRPDIYPREETAA